MEITNATNLRKNLYVSLDSVIEYNEQITVNTKKGNAVIISEEEYRGLVETVYLMSQPGLYEKIKEGEKEKIEDMEVFNPGED